MRAVDPGTQQVIAPMLERDEHIVWCGQPDSRKCASRTIPIVIFGAIWTCGFLIIGSLPLLVPSMTKGSGSFLTLGIVLIPFLLIGIGCMCMPLLASKAAKTVFYALTDKRVIIVNQGRNASKVAYKLTDLSSPTATGGAFGGDVLWSLNPGAVMRQSATSNGRFAQGVQRGTSVRSDGRFGFEAIEDAEKVCKMAMGEFVKAEEIRHTQDPADLERIAYNFLQGKMYVYSGLQMYEFDGFRPVNHKNLLLLAGLVMAPILLSFGLATGFSTAANVVRGSSFSLFSIIPQIMFGVFFVLALVRGAQGRANSGATAGGSAVGMPAVDFNDPRVMAKLQQIYQNKPMGQQQQQSSLIGKIVGILVLCAICGGLMTPAVVSYNEFHKAQIEMDSRRHEQATKSSNAAADAAEQTTKSEKPVEHSKSK